MPLNPLNITFAPQHSLATGAENPAMSLYEIARPDAETTAPTPVLTDVAERLNRGVKAGQNTQMRRALARMDDTTLNQIGVSRKDIPAYARFCIYGK